MKYRLLGETGLKVSEISFGTIPILSGDVPVLPEYFSPDIETAVIIMAYAFQLGCNLFDTAIVPEYGDAEIKVGHLARFVGRERVIISDKARLYDGAEMYEGVRISTRNLGTRPDLYFVHQVDPGNEDLVFGKYGALEALFDLKRAGQINYVGIASHYYEILLRAARDRRVDVLQGSGNILERGMLDRIEAEKYFSRKGLIINKVYAAGTLPSFFPEETLLSGVLSYPVATALVGLGTFAQIDLAMNQRFNYLRPSFAEVMATLEKKFRPISCDRCQRCDCEQSIEISRIFRQYNYHFLGKEYWGLRKLDLDIKESAEKCRRCPTRTCLEKCPAQLNIPLEIKKINKIVNIHIRNSVI